MNTLIPKGTARWMYVPYETEEHRQEITDWIAKCDIDVEDHGIIINPESWKQMMKWFVMTEEDKTIFLLKWR